ncbi:MAG TPA: C25 family cysteine peptidase, partial [Thermoanaerobaculia bacterium]|nr:C25 family cysteine peptidase [Thermoanaerobaculia bacterium]
RRSDRGVGLRVGLRGWSRPRTKGSDEMPDHRVDLLLNGRPLTEAAWNGTDLHVVELPEVPLAHFLADENVLTLVSPGRQQADGRQMVDVVLLDWIELVAPHDGRVGGEQLTLRSAAPAAVHLEADGEGEVLVYGTETETGAGWRAAAGSDTGLVVETGADRLVATRDARLRSPDALAADWPSTLHDASRQADYLMIAHRDLAAAVEPLARFHRQRGLRVEVVDVEDVYDEFGHGVRHPRAIRDFLAYAHASWRSPAPRFVLLVGDASWDTRNERAVDENYADWEHRPRETTSFVKNDSTPYADGALNHRNLVPTLSFDNRYGHAASDNLFVAFADDETADWLPAMAIGRFPVTEPAEVAAIVDKSIRYAAAPEAGDWARQVLFITNDQPGFQKRSDRVAEQVEARGFEAVRIYPQADEPSNEEHTAELMSALDHGALFVHFYGHGGRYIWRTGPPDLEKNHDLLTLDHLDQLAPSARLPVVLSLTCYSAPFDHPSADSIGEKLLRLPGRGAIAVVAASWRNSPRPSWGQALFEELTAPGATIGEALMRAKQRERNRFFVNSYNLLGDPALPVAALAAGEAAAPAVAGLDE